MTDYDAGLGGATLQISAQVASQSISGNYSIVNWQFYLICGNGQSWNADSTYWETHIGGAVYSGGYTFDFRNSSVKLIASGSTQIGHNADGTMAITVYGYTANTGTSAIGGPGSVSGYFPLPTIPRASNLSWSPNPMVAGSAVTINTNRASSSFTHTITYGFGSASGTIGTGVADSISWTPPLSLLTQIPNSTSGTGVLTTTTYNGGSVIGTTYANFTLTADSSIVPSFTSISCTEAVSGVATSVGAFVQGNSKLNVAINGAAGVYGSTITSYKIVVDNQTVNAVSGTTGIVNSSGTLVITGTVIDSRGRTYSNTQNITVLPWIPPSITSCTMARTDSGGNPADDGTYVTVTLNAGVQSLIVSTTQKNSLTYRISSKLHTDSSYTVDKTVTPGGIAFSGSDTVGTFNIEESFDFLVEVIDIFATSATGSVVPTGVIFMHWDGSKGIGFGKYRENGFIDVNGDVYYSGQGYQATHKIIDETTMFGTKTGVVSALSSWNSATVTFTGDSSPSGPFPWMIGYEPVVGDFVELGSVGTSPVTWVILGSREQAGSTYGETTIDLSDQIPLYTADGDLTNQWAPFTATRTSDGIVVLSGLVTKNGWRQPQTVARLPYGFRPDARIQLPIENNDNPRSIDIRADGRIVVQSNTVDGYISFDGIAFPAAGVATWTPPSGYSNGWSQNGGSTYGSVGFWKDSYGGVWCRGQITGGSTGTDNMPMVNLPTGMFPLGGDHMVSTSNAGYGGIGTDVNTPGHITWKPNTSNGWVTLGGAWFESTDSTLTWTAPSYLAGWSQNGTFTVGYTKMSNGLVRLKGLVTGGTIGSSIFTLPAGYRPKNQIMFDRMSNNAFGRMDIYPTGNVIPVIGSNAWYSLFSCVFMAYQ